MLFKNKAISSGRGFESQHELHPTSIEARFDGGLIRGVGGAVWLTRAIRLGPYADAKSLRDQLLAVDSIMLTMSLLAGLADGTSKMRMLSKGSYRHIHFLLVNVPKFFEPDRNDPIFSKHQRDYHDRIVDERLLLCSVMLRPSTRGRGWQGWIDSNVESLVYGGVPLADYELDADEIGGILDRAGMRIPTDQEMRLADSWWSDARRSDSHFAIHPDHLHVFRNSSSAQVARQNFEKPCEEWPRITGHSVLSIGSVSDFDLKFTPSSRPYTQWVSDAIMHGAVAVSIRGSVEPAKISSEEMRRQHRKVQSDLDEMVRANKMARGEREENLALLQQVSRAYEGGGFPTLHDASVLIAFNGRREERKLMQSSCATVRLMENRQLQALKEMQLASAVRANPNKHELPSPVIACSGITSLNRVGDKKGVILGFDERDQQVSYLDHRAASESDAMPITMILGATGSGKTMVALNVADQLQAMQAPVVFIDPKSHTDGEGHAPVVKAMGGQVASLDSLLDSDGVFDPVRFMGDRQSAVETATDLLLQINPWGKKKDDFEVRLSSGLQYGIIERNAQCLGQALRYAYEDGKLDDRAEIFTACEELKDSSPLFGAIYGRDPKGEALNIADGVTLIEVGKATLPVPEPGQPATTITQRTASALVRMMVFGSAHAMTGRFGTVMLDEAWVFLAAGKTEVERLGRLARSQKVFPILLTQKVTDAVDAGLSGYISRGLILHLSDPEQARAALQLFKVEETPERLSRITAKERDDAADDGTSSGGALNPNSLKALILSEEDPEFPGMTRRIVKRGSVAFYSDLSGRFIPVEMVLPDEFLLMASTNPLDIQRRNAVLAHRRREQAKLRRQSQRSEVSVDEFDDLVTTEAEDRDAAESLFEARADQRGVKDVPRAERKRRAATDIDEMEALFND